MWRERGTHWQRPRLRRRRRRRPGPRSAGCRSSPRRAGPPLRKGRRRGRVAAVLGRGPRPAEGHLSLSALNRAAALSVRLILSGSAAGRVRVRAGQCRRPRPGPRGPVPAPPRPSPCPAPPRGGAAANAGRSGEARAGECRFPNLAKEIVERPGGGVLTSNNFCRKVCLV